MRFSPLHTNGIPPQGAFPLSVEGSGETVTVDRRHMNTVSHAVMKKTLCFTTHFDMFERKQSMIACYERTPCTTQVTISEKVSYYSKAVM